jgi:microsomal dipeptidase-like Zn-dependent dipeptidase
MASEVKQIVRGLVNDCEIDLRDYVAKVSHYIMILGSYNIVIGMDWLETHEEVLDCKNKKFYCVDDTGHKIILVGKNQGVSL